MSTVSKSPNGKHCCEKEDRDAEYLHAKCFFTGDIYDASSTIFVDDITKRTVTKTLQEVITKVGKASKLLKKTLPPISFIVMNQSKEEHQVGFVGPGSVKSMRTLYKGNEWPEGMVKLCPTQRVLGTLLTYNCSCVAERQARLRAAQTGWTVMGRFWSAECSLRIRRIILRSMVWSALLTGWETLLPSRADCKAFDKFTACNGRSLMRGKASGRWIDTDGTKRYHALTNVEVLRWLKLVPTHLELQVRRLRWWQTILVDREGNEALLGIFFGRLGAEVEGPLLDDGTLSPNAHPRVLQLEVDLRSLTDIEPGKDFILAWQGNMRKLVVDEECRILFCNIDLQELRMRALYDVECPVWQLAHLRDSTETETDRPFKCSFPLATGTKCQFCSTTMRGLIGHKVGAHGFYDPVQRAVITNECPWCRSVFSTRLDAQHHACSSFLHGSCRTCGSTVHTVIRQPQLPVECPLCKKTDAANHESKSLSRSCDESSLPKFSSVSDYYDHIIRCHLSLPAPRVSGVQKLHSLVAITVACSP